MTPVFIWRMSLKENGGRCTICGAQIIEADGRPVEDNIAVKTEDVNKDKCELICKRCYESAKRMYVVGTCKWVEDSLTGVLKEYDGLNWDEACKLANKKIRREGEQLKSTEEFEKKIRLLEKENESLKQLMKSQVKQVKEEREKERYTLTEKIKALSKENAALEARLKEMEKALFEK